MGKNLEKFKEAMNQFNSTLSNVRKGRNAIAAKEMVRGTPVSAFRTVSSGPGNMANSSVIGIAGGPSVFSNLNVSQNMEPGSIEAKRRSKSQCNSLVTNIYGPGEQNQTLTNLDKNWKNEK